jgi:glycosyltransferase involved in cell wall biosynthesis
LSAIDDPATLPLYRLVVGAGTVRSEADNRAGRTPLGVARLALIHWNSFVQTGRDVHRRLFLGEVSRLTRAEVRVGPTLSVWPTLPPGDGGDNRGMLSSGTQGTVAAVLMRAHLLLGDGAYRVAARRALRALEIEILDGGLASVVGTTGVFFEEAPAYPAAHVFSGAVGLLALYDYFAIFGDSSIEGLIDRAMSTLHSLISLYDTGYWTRVDLVSRRLATREEHALHVGLLKALASYSGCRHCARRADCWERYEKSLLSCVRRSLRESVSRSRRMLLRATAHLLLPPAGRPASGRGQESVCMALPAFPVAGGTRAVVRAIAGVMSNDWDIVYLTNQVGPNPAGLRIEQFGGRLATPWQFPNVWLHTAAGLRRLAGLIRRGDRFKVILPQDGSYTAVFCAIVGKAYGARVVSVEHGTLTFPYSSIYRKERLVDLAGRNGVRAIVSRALLPLYWPSLHIMASVAARLTDQFLVQGDEIEQIYCQRLGVHPSRIVRFLPSIDTDFFKPLHPSMRERERARFGFGPDDTIIVMNGRLAPAKGLDIAVAAVAQARAALPPGLATRLRMIIAGDGPMRDDVEAMINSNKLDSVARLLGEADPETVATLLGIADVFLYTSVRGANVAIAVLEAASAGCAVVASEQPLSHARLLGDGRGIATAPGDLTAVTAALLRVIQNPGVRASMGKLARDYVIQHHSPLSLKRALLRATYYSPSASSMSPQ